MSEDPGPLGSPQPLAIPGLAPGVSQLSLESCGVETSGPTNCARDAAVGPHRGGALHEAHEITQARVRAEAYDKVDMVGEHCPTEDVYPRVAAGAQNGAFHIRDGRLVEQPTRLQVCHVM